MNIKNTILSSFPKSLLDPQNSSVSSDVYLRVELGDGFENRTKARVGQAANRATAIFEKIFLPNDEIGVLIQSFKYKEGVDSFNSDPSYLKTLFPEENYKLFEVEKFVELDEENNEKIYHIQKYGLIDIVKAKYKEIFNGFANLEMGFDPRIGQRIAFVNFRNDVSFYNVMTIESIWPLVKTKKN